MSDSRFRWPLVLYIITLLASVVVRFLPRGYSRALAGAYAHKLRSSLHACTREMLTVAQRPLAADAVAY